MPSIRVLRRVVMRRRGDTSWVVVQWPDGREVARISRREVPPERDGHAVVIAMRGMALAVLSGEDAESAWLAALGSRPASDREERGPTG